MSFKQVGLEMFRTTLMFSGLNSMTRCEIRNEGVFWLDTKDTLGRIQHQFVLLEVIEGFLEVAGEIVSFPGHQRDIVDISMYILTNLVVEA
jgi:hypothetical protein